MLDFDSLFRNINLKPARGDTNIEIEVKFKTKPYYKLVKQYEKLLNHLRKQVTEVVEESTVNQLPNDVRRIITQPDNQIVYQQKQRIRNEYKYQDDYGFTVSISEETILPSYNMKKSTPITNTRHRYRHKFRLNEDYEVDLTEVYHTTPLHTTTSTAVNANEPQLEIELEFVGNPDHFNMATFITNIKNIYTIINGSENFVLQPQISHLITSTNTIFNTKTKDDKYIDKNILVKARNIKYIDLIYGGIVGNPSTSYVIAHKADGERHYLIFNNIGTWLVSSTTFNLLSPLFSTKTKQNTTDIYECEVINNINNTTYYILVYDTLAIDSKDIRNQPLQERMSHIDKVTTIDTTNMIYKIIKKNVRQLSLDTYFETMQTMFDEQANLLYPQDGFIITPTTIYNSGSDKLPLFKRRLLTHPDICKWKPPHNLTIDFRVIYNNTDQNILVSLLVYDAKEGEIPFWGTQNNPLLITMIDTSFYTDIHKYENKIVECSYDIVCKTIKPTRIRHDKSGPNKLDIAEANWHDIHDPILQDDLTGNSLELVKKYHNQIKNILYGIKTPYAKFDNLTIKKHYNLLDIGGGRGGDLQKWLRSDVNKVVTVEPNNDNLDELFDRLQYSELRTDVIPIRTVGEDTTTITEVVDFNMGKADVVSLMLSLSFFYASPANLDSLVNTIVHNINQDGYVLFFTIDGTYLQQQLKNNNDSITYNNATFTLYNNKYVRAIIPGIVDKQWEFLVNIDELTQKLGKYGIEMGEQRRANDELLLSASQKSYSNLFTYGYYQKIKDTPLPPLANLTLPTITYPEPITTSLTSLIDKEVALIKNTLYNNLIRIGTHTKDSFIHAILKAYSTEYQETEDEKQHTAIVNQFRVTLSEAMTDETWLTFNNNLYPTLLLKQLSTPSSNTNQIDDYTAIGLRYYLQSPQLSPTTDILSFIAHTLQTDIYIFTYDEDLTLYTTSLNCHHYYEDAILLLQINNHYELLGEKSKIGIKTLFSQYDDLLYKLPSTTINKNMTEKTQPLDVTIKQTFGTHIPTLEGQLVEGDPLYTYIEEIYTPPEFYINALLNTIKKHYSVNERRMEDMKKSIERLYISKNKEVDFFTILKSLKRLKKNPQRVEERVKHINQILTTLNFDTRGMKVLDIGAGNGDIISAIQQFYNLPASDTYAIDQKLPEIKNVTTLTYNSEGHIPLPDKSINLILLFAVLHHIPPDIRTTVMNEVQRLITPGGIVIIREHDDLPTDSFYLTYIELIHMFWYLAEDEQEDPLYLLTYAQTSNLFTSRNFTSAYLDYYADPNPQRLYYEAFQSFYDDFPYKRYSMDTNDLDKRFNNLKRYKFDTIKTPYIIKNIPGTWYQSDTYKNKKLRFHNLIIINKPEDYLRYNLISDYFMDPCRMQAKRYDQPLTPFEYWQQNKDYVYQMAHQWYGEANDYTLRETIYKLAGEVTSFRPTLMAGFIHYFKSKKVLDFSAGHGDRLIAALATNVDFYCGVDPNHCVHDKYQEMIKYFGGDSHKFLMLEAPFESVELPDVMYDLVLTSPPYFNLEVYSDEVTQSIHNRDLEAWFNEFLMFSLNKAWDRLEKGGHMVIIINDIRGGPHYCKRMVDEFTKQHLSDGKYEGIISYSEFVDNLPKNPNSCFIWTKTDILPSISTTSTTPIVKNIKKKEESKKVVEEKEEKKESKKENKKVEEKKEEKIEEKKEEIKREKVNEKDIKLIKVEKALVRDKKALAELTKDKEMMQYIGNGKSWDIDYVKSLTDDDQYKNWIIKDKEKVVGYVGLRPIKGKKGLQIRIFVSTPGKGIATIAINKVKQLTDETLWAVVLPDNTASNALFRHWRFEGTEMQHGKLHNLYSL